jgi:6-phosphogluconolactonase
VFGAGLPDEMGGSRLWSFRLNRETGKLSPAGNLEVGSNVTFAALDPRGRHLFAVTEVGSAQAMSFAIDAASGQLTAVSKVPAKAAPAVAASVDARGRFLLVAGFGGAVSVVPIDAGGALGDATAYKTGGGTHDVRLDPGNKYAYACAMLGKTIHQFRFDEGTGKLEPHPKGDVATGAYGPRHLAFHPGGRWVFVVFEIGNRIQTFEIGADGALQAVGDPVPTFPPNARCGHVSSQCAAEVKAHPSGRFVYVTNRSAGDAALATFAVGADGRLAPLAFTGEQVGPAPRAFDLDPGGRFLFVAKQTSGNIAGYAIDPESGAVKFVGAVHLGRSAPWTGVAIVP